MTKVICYDDYCKFNDDNECQLDEIILEVNPTEKPNVSAVNKCTSFEVTDINWEEEDKL